MVERDEDPAGTSLVAGLTLDLLSIAEARRLSCWKRAFCVPSICEKDCGSSL